MPHPRRLVIKFLLLTFVILATILLIKPNDKLKAQSTSGCPAQDLSKSQIKVNLGFLSISNSGDSGNYYAPSTDTDSNCLINPAAQIESEFLSFDALFKSYYTKLTSSSVVKSPIQNGSDIKLASGSTITPTIYTNSVSAGGSGLSIILPGAVVQGVHVVFIDGDLEITGDIKDPAINSDQNGVIFVVKGKLNIDKIVQQVDAFIISYGAFCDNWDSVNGCNNPPGSTGVITFHGSIISLNPPAPTPTASLKFTRVSNDPANVPAENLIYQAKYFILFKDIFSKNKIIWTEIK